jgi:hypothetical protein
LLDTPKRCYLPQNTLRFFVNCFFAHNSLGKLKY